MDCEAGDKLFWKHGVSEKQGGAEMKGNKDQVAHNGALVLIYGCLQLSSYTGCSS